MCYIQDVYKFTSIWIRSKYDEVLHKILHEKINFQLLKHFLFIFIIRHIRLSKTEEKLTNPTHILMKIAIIFQLLFCEIL